MKVKDLDPVVRQLSTEAANSSSAACDAFQSFVQRRKAEHHRRAAGTSVVTSLAAEIEGLVLIMSSEGSIDNNACCSSLDFLRRHARCLALLVGWVETKLAAAEVRVDAKMKHLDVNDVSSQMELAALVNTLVALVTADLSLLNELSSRGGVTFHSAGKEDAASPNQEADLETLPSPRADCSCAGDQKWYREDVHRGIHIALLLLCIIARPPLSSTVTHSSSSSSSDEATIHPWTKELMQTEAPSEVQAEVRALVLLLRVYRGEVPTSAPLWPQLSAHEDLLLLRTAAQQQQQQQQQQHSSTELEIEALSTADAARGAGGTVASSAFRLDGGGGESERERCPPVALATLDHARPHHCADSEEDWPVGGRFSLVLRGVFADVASVTSAVKKDPAETTRRDVVSFFALLHEWREFLVPCACAGTSRETASASGGASFEDGDAALSSLVLHMARLATKVACPPQGRLVVAPAPPSIVPRAVMMALARHGTCSNSEDAGGRRRFRAQFPLQSGALVLAVNTCCDLTGASFQAWRQQECLAALLASLLASSSAVLSQAASWLFPKLMQNLDVVTEAGPKFLASRCVQVLIAALPQESTARASSSTSSDNSQLRLTYAHQLVLKMCRDLHLHPSALQTEAMLLALQPFLCLCPIGVLLAQSQALAEVLSAVMAANTAAVMEALGGVLLRCRQEAHSGAGGAIGSSANAAADFFSKDEAKSLRLVMHCLRALCLLCRRCPLQMRAQSLTVLLGPLRMYLLLLPLPSFFKTGPTTSAGSDTGVDVRALMTGLALGGGGGEGGEGRGACVGYCRWLWLSVCAACCALRTTCPEEWKRVTAALVQEQQT